MQQKARLNVHKKQRRFYSGKKKRHTLKTQVIYHPQSRQIVGITIDQGRKHDINIAKSTITSLCHYRYLMADLGYYGLKEVGFKLLMPIKKKKGLALLREKKQFNH